MRESVVVLLLRASVDRHNALEWWTVDVHRKEGCSCHRTMQAVDMPQRIHHPRELLTCAH